MKKSLIIFLAFLFLSTIVLAVDVSKIINNPETKTTEEGLFKKFDKQTEDILQKPAYIPQPLQLPVKIILGIKEETTWQEFIVILGILIGFFILMLGILEILSFMNEGVTRVLGAIVITSLVSITGALRYMTAFLFNLVGFFKWIESWSILTLLLVIILAFLIIVSFHWFTRKILKEKKLTEAEETGKALRRGRKSAELFSKVLDENLKY